MRPEAVIKVGGSLIRSPAFPSLLETLDELAATRRIVVVPGGGPFADAVRDACALHDPGDSAAHWMAILAMDQHAHLLAALLPRARVTSSAEETAQALAEGHLPVLAPFRWLRAADPLPHGWHVTSDSIAAWIAARLCAPRLVLVKAAPGLPGPDGAVVPIARLPSPALKGIVDEYFEEAIEPGLSCWAASAHHPERLAEVLSGGREQAGARPLRARALRARPARARR